MARAWLRFYAELNDFLPPTRRQCDIPVEFAPPTPVGHLIEGLGVPHTEVELVLLNGVSVGLDARPGDGERISVYPMFEALDVTPLLRIRPRPLREPRFLADAHLGKLAHLLRMLGFDTLYFNDLGDARLAEISADEGRVLLTRDRALLMHKRVTHGCYIRSREPRAQLRQVILRLDLLGQIRPFSRCMECNGPLEAVARQGIAAELPKGVVDHYNAFWRCPGCRRIYWKGNHYRAMQAWIETLQSELAQGGRERPYPKTREP